jgi:hypothetical protein
VLRITLIADGPDGACLQVEGRLAGDWIALLEGELEKAARTGVAQSLDLSAVDFASPRATQMLRAALARGVCLSACSPLLFKQLSEEPV